MMDDYYNHSQTGLYTGIEFEHPVSRDQDVTDRSLMQRIDNSKNVLNSIQESPMLYGELSLIHI